jgi:hypothetical protein
MDFSAIFQLRTKKYWWLDVIFYVAISLLIATVFCFVIFWGKNHYQRQDIEKVTKNLQSVGTFQQKENETEVQIYQKKVQDFTLLFKDHEFASNVFAFLQDQTMPSIWYNQFSLDEKNHGALLTGEAESMDAFSRQVGVFENNKYVKSITALNSSIANSARIQFTMSLNLDGSIFSYTSTMARILKLASNAKTTKPATSSASLKSSEKNITAFHLLLDPEVEGIVDQTNFSVAINVPFGTDVKALVTSIVTSSDAAVSPTSGVLQDFTNPVDYTVKAQDGSTQIYAVKVNVLPQVVAKKAENPAPVGLIVSIILAVVIILAAAIFIILKKSKKKQP